MSVPSHRRPSRQPTRSTPPPVPLSGRRLAAAGWTPAGIRHALARADIARLRRDVFVGAEAVAPGTDPPWQRRREDLLLAARAAAVSSPRAVTSHVAAAVRHGLPTLWVPERPCLTVPAGTGLRRLAGAHLHRATLTSDDVVVLGDDVVTSPARTIMDIAREHGRDVAVVAGDAALHDGLVTATGLRDSYEQCSGWPGRRAARLALVAMDGRSESPLETLSRLRVAALRLPEPELQTTIRDGCTGAFIARTDFYWDRFGVVGEADGDLKYGDESDLIAERLRQQRLEDAGLIVVRWGIRDLRDFAPTAARLRTAFGRGPAPGSPLRRWRAVPLCTPQQR